MPLRAHLYEESKAKTAFAVLQRLSFIKWAYVGHEEEKVCFRKYCAQMMEMKNKIFREKQKLVRAET